LRPCDLESCDSWHSPSNAHAYRLYVVKELVAAFAATHLSAQAEILTCF
jgi:hypothetical protein